MIERSLLESIGDKKEVVDIGKGGVGKSTVTGAMALNFADRGLNTIVVDMDAAHSSLHTLGVSNADFDDPERTQLVETGINNLRAYLLSQIVPDIFPEEGMSDSDVLNRYLDSLLPEGTLFPLMRMALHPNFSGVPLEHGNFAYVLQMMELLSNNKVFDIQPKKLSITSNDAGNVDRVIIDSENTQGILRITRAVKNLERSISNIHGAVYGGMKDKVKLAGTRVAVEGQSNLKKLSQSEVVKNPEEYLKEMKEFTQKFFNAAIVIVTQPGFNDIKQTLGEIEQLQRFGLNPDHVVVNKYKLYHDQDAEAAEHCVDALKEFNSDIGLSVIEADYHTPDLQASEEDIQKVIHANLRAIAENFKQ